MIYSVIAVREDGCVNVYLRLFKLGEVELVFLQVPMLTGSVSEDIPQRDLHEPVIDDFCFMQPPYGTVSNLCNCNEIYIFRLHFMKLDYIYIYIYS